MHCFTTPWAPSPAFSPELYFSLNKEVSVLSSLSEHSDFSLLSRNALILLNCELSLRYFLSILPLSRFVVMLRAGFELRLSRILAILSFLRVIFSIYLLWKFMNKWNISIVKSLIIIRINPKGANSTLQCANFFVTSAYILWYINLFILLTVAFRWGLHY